VILNKGTYFLKEFDKTELASTYTSNCLKKFVQRNRFYMLVATGTNLDNNSITNSFIDNRDLKLFVLDNLTVCKSTWI
jgi:hypothetical protein